MAKKSKKAKPILKWVVAIVVIVLVLCFVLLDVFGITSPSSPYYGVTPCLAATGYACQNLTLQSSSNTLTVVLTQTTGTEWLTANIYYIPQGTASTNAIPVIIATTLATVPTTANILATGLISGKPTSVLLGIPGGGPTAGTTAEGAIWAQYYTSSGGPYYTQMATVILNAT